TNSDQATNMGALAYTQGNDVHFAPGQYNPGSQQGQELIGHELTHVVQQRQGRVAPTKQGKGLPVNDNPALEKEADEMGAKAAQGGGANVVGAGLGIQRQEAKKFIVPEGWGLARIANHLGVSIDALKEANRTKLKSFSNGEGFIAGEEIVIPSTIIMEQSSDSETETNNNPEETVNKNSLSIEDQELVYGQKVSEAFRKKVVEVSNYLGADPNHLMAIMAFESAGTFSPSVKNAAGSGATGLIQFMPSTAINLGTTTDALAKMTALEQLDYVKQYFEWKKGKLKSIDDFYMAVLWPAACGKSEDYVLFDKNSEDTKKAYNQNKGLDANNDGQITKAEASAKVRESLTDGEQLKNTIVSNNSEQVQTNINNQQEKEVVTPDIQITSNFTETYIVQSGESLSILAQKFNVSIEQLKSANSSKLQSWNINGNIVVGFNSGENIKVPQIENQENNTEVTNSEVNPIEVLNNKFKSKELGMPEFARALLPYISKSSNQIMTIMNNLDYLDQDNFAYALAANSSDSDLAKFDKTLLKKMSIALDTWLTWSRTENLKQKERVDKCLGTVATEQTDDKAIYNEEGRNEAVEFVKNNKEAYLEGDERWESGTRNSKSYNNILIVNKDEADGSHLKVYRKFSSGVYTLIDKETLTDAKYTEEKALATYHNTYCNIAATKIGLSYGAPNIQNYGGSEHNANAIYNNFINNFYNTDTHEFKEVEFDEAEQYASSGGLAYAVWKNSTGGSGHIGTITGGYGGDGEKTMANLKIFQAGNTFGDMTYSGGFGNRDSKFYVWKKK
ncbi:DUF4157 domain-containing protein, partial [Candidatus Woesearchaeota archaeon]|nr:DUF4157 domain-containing protein [Candidatus Woesearchaeota archaeon]MBN2817677.1 DUF4157 domain-containing protein [Bacteroidales bacterium]